MKLTDWSYHGDGAKKLELSCDEVHRLELPLDKVHKL